MCSLELYATHTEREREERQRERSQVSSTQKELLSYTLSLQILNQFTSDSSSKNPDKFERTSQC